MPFGRPPETDFEDFGVSLGVRWGAVWSSKGDLFRGPILRSILEDFGGGVGVEGGPVETLKNLIGSLRGI